MDERRPDRVARSTRTFRHVAGLDGLRGIAVVLVVASHADQTLPPGSPIDLPYRLVHGGFLGVDLFFVLSGFLITALLIDEAGAGGIRAGAFYVRRALRLLPALYVFLALHLVFATLEGLHPGNEGRSVLSAILYVSNWQSANQLLSVSPGMGHLWSLAVEEQFYLVWPLVLATFLRFDPSRRVLPVVLVVASVAVAVHRAVLWDHGVLWLRIFVRTDTRADALLIGALAAVLWHAAPPRAPERLRRWAWVSAGVLAVLVIVSRYDEAPVYLGGFTAFAVATAVVLVAATETGWGDRVLGHPILRTLGRVSYGLYLWHLLVFVAVGRWMDPDVAAVPRLALGVGISVGFTAASYWAVERPALRLKRRFERRGAALP